MVFSMTKRGAVHLYKCIVSNPVLMNLFIRTFHYYNLTDYYSEETIDQTGLQRAETILLTVMQINNHGIVIDATMPAHGAVHISVDELAYLYDKIPTFALACEVDRVYKASHELVTGYTPAQWIHPCKQMKADVMMTIIEYEIDQLMKRLTINVN